MTRDLKSAYRLNEPMTLDERAEAQREIVAEYQESLRGGLAMASKAAEGRGYSVDPRIVEARRWQVYGSGQAGQGDVVGAPLCPSPISALGQSQPGSARSANCRSAEPD